MTHLNNSIFREKALENYVQNQEAPVSPPTISSHIFTFLWLVLGLLVVGSVFTLTLEIPTYVAGTGLSLTENGTPIIIAAFPSELHSQIQTGQTLTLMTTDTQSRNIETTVVVLETQLLSSDQIHTQYNLVPIFDEGTATIVVAQFTVDSEPTLTDQTNYPIRLLIGSRNLVSLISP